MWTATRGRYELLNVGASVRNRPAIACILLGVVLILVTFFLGSTAVKPSEANPENDESPRDDQNTAKGISDPGSPDSTGEQVSRKGWFEADPPGIDAIHDKKRSSIWQYELSLKVNESRTQRERRHPQMAFIKGLKVGGTSVAVALDNVARRYGIRLQSKVTETMNRDEALDTVHCVDGSLWFHHGYKHEWMKRCIQNVRFLTLLREPISQTLSWEAMQVSHEYYLNYPRKDCEKPRQIEVRSGRGIAALNAMLRHVDHCVDTPYRKNVTLMLVAHAVTEFQQPVGDHYGFPGMAVALSAQWVLGGTSTYGHLTGKHYIKYLQENYFLVGVTERLNEFLVLLALHMGWDPASLYYVYCKPTTSDVHKAEFAHYFPQLMPKLERSTAVAAEAYEWAKSDFDSHVKKLGSWFQDIVIKFEAGLKAYQEKARNKARPYQWTMHYYLDHHSEDC